jgi:hypothetical protein
MAARIVCDEGPCELIYTDPGAEHHDNKRFLKDCERWLQHEVVTLRSDRYKDIWDVFKKTRFLVGPYGARCTTELKRVVREKYQRADDVHVFGFTAEEELRHLRFGAQNKGVKYRSPLLEHGLTKADCFRTIQAAGIELPAMYRLGYTNNNCIGCVKGQAGYWNKIRVDFPEVFTRMAGIERELDISINRGRVAGKRYRVFLDELPPDSGRYASEPSISCGAVCEVNFEQVDDE